MITISDFLSFSWNFTGWQIAGKIRNLVKSQRIFIPVKSLIHRNLHKAVTIQDLRWLLAISYICVTESYLSFLADLKKLSCFSSQLHAQSQKFHMTNMRWRCKLQAPKVIHPKLSCRGNRSQMFFKIGLLKNFVICTGKHLF